MSLTDLDPTGTLSAASSAIKLVGAVLKVAPAVKNATASSRATAAAGRGPQAPGPAATVPVAPTKKDPERERKAYETANYVLREFGSRLCAAGLVDEHALTTALTSAAQHVDMRLFSGEANRLFASLAPKLADPLLVNSVFTSIYFIGVLVSELTRSLPNYKDSYTRLGPKLVQQLFRSAIGEDAFRENLGANLDAYETLATTAGLLRPTDSELRTFPGFPAFSTGRYSSRAFGDVRGNKSTYEKLIKHFERSGFPQPLRELQEDVGIIRDWRFLDGETNSRNVDVDKADKNVGENYGRVVHWLVSSADRMPAGQAIIAFYDQHVELIRWIGGRLGYALLEPARDLNMTGPHISINGKLKSVMNSWVILMFSEKSRMVRQEATSKWTRERTRAAEAASKAGMVNAPSSAASSPDPASQRRSSFLQSVPKSPDLNPPAARGASALTSTPELQETRTSVESQLNHINFWFNTQLKPQCQVFVKMPPTNPKARNLEAQRLADLTERELLYKLDALEIPESHPGRAQRKAMIEQAQSMMATVEAFNKANEQMEQPALARSTSATNPEIIPSLTRSSTISTTSTLQSSPPPYSPVVTTRRASETASLPFQEKRTTVVRRKAPPPPKKTISAQAIYDFAPEDDNEEELAVKEGDDLEIVEKTAALEEEGWCKAKIKGTTKVGLVPLEYLEITAATAASNTSVPKPISTSAVKPDQSQTVVVDQTSTMSQGHGTLTTAQSPQSDQIPVKNEQSAGMGTTAAPKPSTTAQTIIPDTKPNLTNATNSGPSQTASAGQPNKLSQSPAQPSTAQSPPSSQPPVDSKQSANTGRKGLTKAETAKLGLAAVGATAGIATFVTTRERGHEQSEFEHTQEAETSHAQSSDRPDQNITENTTNEASTSQIDSNTNDSLPTAPLGTNDGAFDTYVPPATDLSSLGGGQDSQYPMYQTPLAVDPALTSDSTSPFASLAMPQDTTYQDPMASSSPFAGLAAPSDPVDMAGSSDVVEDDTLIVSQTTADTVDGTWTETDIDIVDADASLDLI